MCVEGSALLPLDRRVHAAPTPVSLCPPRCAAVTPRPCHRQRAGVGRVAPTGRPRATHALHALECAGHELPADSRATMAAGTAPDTSCGGRPHSLPTEGVTADRPAPGPALGAPARVSRAGPRRCTAP